MLFKLGYGPGIWMPFSCFLVALACRRNNGLLLPQHSPPSNPCNKWATSTTFMMRVPLWVCTYEFWITRLPVPVSHLQVPASSLCTFSPQTRACSHPCQSRSQYKQVSALSAEIHISKSIFINSREHAEGENTHWYCYKHWHASESSAAFALHSFVEASDFLNNLSAYRTGNIESSRSEFLWGDQVKKRTWLVWSLWVPVPVSEYCTIQDDVFRLSLSLSFSW